MTQPRGGILLHADEAIVRKHLEGIVRADTAIEWIPANSVDELARSLEHIDFLCVLDGQLSPDVVELLKGTTRPPNWIQIASSGYERAAQAGLLEQYRCANAPDSNATTVAEHAMALTLATTRNIPRMVRMQDSGRWSRSEGSLGLRSLAGATVTILGTGHIGSEIARMLKPFRVTVTGVSRSGTARVDGAFDRLETVKALPRVLTTTDILVVSLPSTAETRSLLTASVLEKMTANSMLVNMARGNLIAAEVLDQWIAASSERRLSLDVIPEEPPADPGHWSNNPQVLISPHVAGFGGDASSNLARLMEENAHRFQSGDVLRWELRTDQASTT